MSKSTKWTRKLNSLFISILIFLPVIHIIANYLIFAFSGTEQTFDLTYFGFTAFDNPLRNVFQTIADNTFTMANTTITYGVIVYVFSYILFVTMCELILAVLLKFIQFIRDFIDRIEDERL